jgi:hypothetical protein
MNSEKTKMARFKKFEIVGLVAYSVAVAACSWFIFDALMLGKQGPGKMAYLSAGPVLVIAVIRLFTLAVRAPSRESRK